MFSPVVEEDLWVSKTQTRLYCQMEMDEGSTLCFLN